MGTPSKSNDDLALTRAPARRGHHAHPRQLIFIGLILCVFAVVILTLQTQTTQDLINHVPASRENITTELSFWLWLRVPKLVGGDAIPGPGLDANDLPGIIVSQLAEFLYIAILWAMGTVYATARSTGKVAGTIIIVLLAAVCILDFTSDVSYGNYAPDTHIYFAIALTLGVGFLPTLGIALMSEGWKRS